ncbi:Beta-barrel assembly-enhancing protease [compost metagenome]
MIHEQASPSALRLGRPLGLTHAKITHRGYLTPYMEQRNKAERNLQIVLKQVAGEPENAYAHFNLGQTYSLLGKDFSEEAEKAYLQSLALLQQQQVSLDVIYYTTLYVNFVELYRSVGQVEKGLKLVGEALGKFPGVPDLLYLKGQLLLDSERYHEAIQAFQLCKSLKGQLIAGGSDTSIPTYKSSKALGKVYLSLNQDELAKRHLLEASEEVDRPDFELQTLLGLASMKLGDHATALNCFILATELDSENAMAWFNMGLVAYRRKEYALAYEAWLKSHELDPTPERALNLGMVLMRLQRCQEAENLLEQELESDPAFASAWLQLGMARLGAGNTQGAREAWEMLLEIPDLKEAVRAEVEALRVFCRLLAEEGPVTIPASTARPEVLLAAWEAAIDLLFDSGRYAEAERVLEALKHVSVPGLNLRVGYQLVGFGLLDEAIAFLLKACEEDPQNALVYEVLGDVTRDLGHAEDAQVMYQTALTLKPRQANLRLKLQQLRDSMKD